MMNWNFRELTLIVAVLVAAADGVAAEDEGALFLGGTNLPSSTLDALVAEALEKNPELNFYQAEIAA